MAKVYQRTPRWVWLNSVSHLSSTLSHDQYPSMRMEHKAGDKMFVDYTGDKLWIYPHSEPPREVDVFVAISGCSLLTYVEAVSGQSKEDFISACENSFYFYGGVPQAVVPDNLKAAVTKASRHEFILNEEFERFAEHYGVTVFPRPCS